jgi:hypothetical protein
MKNICKLMSVLFVLASLSSCSATRDTILYCGPAFVLCLPSVNKIDRDCINDPPQSLPSSVKSRSIAIRNLDTLSWLDLESYPNFAGFNRFEILDFTKLLAHMKFEAIELKIPPRTKFTTDLQSKVLFLEQDNLPEWVRISLEEKGHASCERFERGSNNRSSLEYLLQNEFTKNKCIAIEPISSPSSEYGFDIQYREDSSASAPRYMWKIESIKSGTTYAELYLHAGNMQSCPSYKVRRKFIDIVVPQ